MRRILTALLLALAPALATAQVRPGTTPPRQPARGIQQNRGAQDTVRTPRDTTGGQRPLVE
ncbi:MAG TPA: hypothetical protein VHM30_08185, partial [Gemmatimonadaceae bacterium]|nr:hypothetical protein [Gemmatimonadaceae bacterium]